MTAPGTLQLRISALDDSTATFKLTKDQVTDLADHVRASMSDMDLQIAILDEKQRLLVQGLNLGKIAGAEYAGQIQTLTADIRELAASTSITVQQEEALSRVAARVGAMQGALPTGNVSRLDLRQSRGLDALVMNLGNVAAMGGNIEHSIGGATQALQTLTMTNPELFAIVSTLGLIVSGIAAIGKASEEADKAEVQRQQHLKQIAAPTIGRQLTPEEEVQRQKNLAKAAADRSEAEAALADQMERQADATEVLLEAAAAHSPTGPNVSGPLGSAASIRAEADARREHAKALADEAKAHLANAAASTTDQGTNIGDAELKRLKDELATVGLLTPQLVATRLAREGATVATQNQAAALQHSIDVHRQYLTVLEQVDKAEQDFTRSIADFVRQGEEARTLRVPVRLAGSDTYYEKERLDDIGRQRLAKIGDRGRLLTQQREDKDRQYEAQAAQRQADADKKKAEDALRSFGAVSIDIAKVLTDVFVNLGTTIGNIFAGVHVTLSSVFSDLRKLLGGFLTDLGRTMIASGTAGLAMKAFVSNPFGAIAAGVALVALGTALSGSAQNSVNSLGSGGSSSAAVSTPTPSSSLAGSASTGTIVIHIDGFDPLNPAHLDRLREAQQQLKGLRFEVGP